MKKWKKWKQITCGLTAAVLASTAIPLPAMASLNSDPISIAAEGEKKSLEILPDDPAEMVQAGNLEEAAAIPLKEGNNPIQCSTLEDEKTIISFTPEKTKYYQIDVSGVQEPGYTGYGYYGFWYYDENGERQAAENVERTSEDRVWDAYRLEQGITYYFSVSIDLDGHEVEGNKVDCVFRIANLVASWSNFYGNLEELPGYDEEMEPPHCTVYGENEDGILIHEEMESVFDYMQADDPTVLAIEKKNGVYRMKAAGLGSTTVRYTAAVTYGDEKFTESGQFEFTVTDKKYLGGCHVNGVRSTEYHLVPGQKLQIQPVLDCITKAPNGEDDVWTEVSLDDYRVEYRPSQDEPVIAIDANGVVQANNLGECQVYVDFYINDKRVDTDSFYVQIKDEVSAAALYRIDGDEEIQIAQQPPCSHGSFREDISLPASKGSAVKLKTRITTYTKDNLAGTESVYANPNFYVDDEDWQNYTGDFTLGNADGVVTISDKGDWDDETAWDYPYCYFYGNIKVNDNLIAFPFKIVFEDEMLTEGDYQYQGRKDGTVQITKYLGTESQVKVPARIAGKAVTSIRKFAFQNCVGLTSLELPESITSIGEFAFDGCTQLELVVKLGSYAEFYAKENAIPYRYINQAEIKAAKDALSATKISKASIALQTGNKGNTATIQPEYPKNFTEILQKAGLRIASVAYKSSRPEIASVTANGKVTGIKAGSATITTTVTLNDGSKKTLQTTVTVKAGNQAEIQAVKKALNATKISKTTATLYTGKVSHTVTLKPNYPKNFTKTLQKAGLRIASVAYVSSAPKKASVTANGKVTGLKAGNATITATVTLSDKSKKTLQTKITVKKPSLEISGKKSVKKGKSLTLKVKKYGVSGAASWSVDKTKLASINKKTGKLTAKAAGTVKVTVKIGTVKTTWKVVIKK